MKKIVQQTKLKPTNQKPWEDQLQIYFGPQPQLPKGLFWQRGKTINQSNNQKRMIHIMQTIVILAKPKTELNYSNSRPHPHSHTHEVDQKVVPLLSMNSLDLAIHFLSIYNNIIQTFGHWNYFSCRNSKKKKKNPMPKFCCHNQEGQFLGALPLFSVIIPES